MINRSHPLTFSTSITPPQSCHAVDSCPKAQHQAPRARPRQNSAIFARRKSVQKRVTGGRNRVKAARFVSRVNPHEPWPFSAKKRHVFTWLVQSARRIWAKSFGSSAYTLFFADKGLVVPHCFLAHCFCLFAEAPFVLNILL